MTAVLTGASSGIGYELARRYIEAGHTLHLIARRKEKLQELQELANSKKIPCYIYPIDLADLQAVRSCAASIAQNSDKIDQVIANAGISMPHSSGLPTLEDFSTTLTVNTLSVHALFEPLIPKLQAQKSGTLVVISSLASFAGLPTALAYSTSKRALNAYTEGLDALLAAEGISVVTILPGFIKTPMTDKNRFFMPFLMGLEDGVNRIERAIEKKKAFTAFPFAFASCVRLTGSLPYFLKRLVLRAALSHGRK